VLCYLRTFHRACHSPHLARAPTRAFPLGADYPPLQTVQASRAASSPPPVRSRGSIDKALRRLGADFVLDAEDDGGQLAIASDSDNAAAGSDVAACESDSDEGAEGACPETASPVPALEPPTTFAETAAPPASPVRCLRPSQGARQRHSRKRARSPHVRVRTPGALDIACSVRKPDGQPGPGGGVRGSVRVL